jgi:DNA end-binding protein Ku
MAPRPNWKGYLKLSLVSCPVALYTATSSNSRISLHILNRETGNRVKRQWIDAETGDVVDTDAQVHGYEVDRHDYVEVEDEDLDKIALESTHTIDIERFVPRRDVDPLYMDTPYFLIPNDEVGREAFAVIREAMRQEKMVGIAKVVLARRERIVMLEPRESGIVATTLRYANEVRPAADYFEDIPEIDVPAEMLDLAKHIIQTKEGKFEPERFQDRYEAALVEMIKEKKAGHEPRAPAAAPRPSNVVNLMDALRRSVEESGGGGGAPAAKSRPAKTKTKGPAKAAKAERGGGRKTAARTRKAG